MDVSQVYDEVTKTGFYPEQVIADGTLRRFKRDGDDKGKSAWYVCHQNHSHRGDLFFVAVWGDWRDSEEFKFITSFTQTKYDRQYIEDQLKKAKAKKAKEQERIWNATSEKAKELWAGSKSLPSSGYLERKQIKRLTAKVISSAAGKVLQIPVIDVDGKIWGLQYIKEDGEKRFLTGTKKRGNFHAIPSIEKLKNAKRVYICEGFATAATVYLATDIPVIVCFDAGNLAPVIEKLIKDQGREIIICGEDDKYKKENVGRAKAEAVSKKFLVSCVFPKFKSETTKPTDFNDLHVLEGMEEVEKQLGAVKAEKNYIIPLGYDGGDYYFVSNINKQVQRISSSSMATATALCRLQPLGYWESRFPGQKGGIALMDAADTLMSECHAKGVFRPDSVRGRGIWSDGEQIIYHMGDALHTQGSIEPLHFHKFHSDYIYEEASRLPRLHKKQLSIEEIEPLLDVSQMLAWKKPEDAIFFTGWIGCAFLSGIMPWRPHIWLTGGAGTGKSYVMNQVMHLIMRPYCYFFQGQTTEAGLRQTVKNESLPIIFDEFEPNDPKSGARIQGILEYARQASSMTGGLVAKGTPTGQAIQFRTHSPFFVSSIKTHLEFESDKSRFTVIELDRQGEDRVARFKAIREKIATLPKDFGHRLFTRVVQMAEQGIPQANFNTFMDCLSHQESMRVSQQFGALLTGYSLLCADEFVDQETAQNIYDGIHKGFDVEDAASDERSCLDHLLGSIFDLEVWYNTNQRERRNISFGMILQFIKQGEIAAAMLPQYGLKYEEGNLYIANRHPFLMQRVFRNTQWAKDWARPLKRLAKSQKTTKAIRFNSVVSKAIYMQF